MGRVLKRTDSVQLHAGQLLATVASVENRAESPTETLPHTQQPSLEPSKESVAHQTHQLHTVRSLETGANEEHRTESLTSETLPPQLSHTLIQPQVTVTPHQDPLSSSHQLSVDSNATALQPMENMPVDRTFNHSSHLFSLPPTMLGLPTSSDLSGLQNTQWAAWGSEPFSYGTNLGGDTPVNGQLYHNTEPLAAAFNFGVSQSTVLTDAVTPLTPNLPKVIHDDMLLAFQKKFTGTSGTSDALPSERLNNITASNAPLFLQENPEKITTPGASSTVSEPLPSEPLPLSDTTVNHTVPPPDSTTLPSTLQEDDATTIVSGKENCSARLRKPATSKQMPPMIWRDQAYRYLLVDLEDNDWKDCVEKWLAFEKQEEGAFDTNSVCYFYFYWS